MLLPAAFRSLSRPSSSLSSIGIHHRPMFCLTILFFLLYTRFRSLPVPSQLSLSNQARLHFPAYTAFHNFRCFPSLCVSKNRTVSTALSTALTVIFLSFDRKGKRRKNFIRKKLNGVPVLRPACVYTYTRLLFNRLLPFS